MSQDVDVDSLRVLIVEDDEDLAAFLQTILHRRLGRQPDTVMTVEAATARLTTVRVDAVIVDVDWMKLSAPDIVHRLRSSQPDVIVVVIGSSVPLFPPIPDVAVLEKPMSAGALWRVIEQARR
jgi:DNA-binding NtrC family response regulator